MALIVSRATLSLTLALAFGIAAVFPEQKLLLYVVSTLFVIVTIVSNVWFTHQNVKRHTVKFNKYVAYFLSSVSGLLYIEFVIYILTIGSYDVLPIIIFAISTILVQILESILGTSIKNTRPSNKQLKVISKQRVQQFKVISLILVSMFIVLIFITLVLKWWSLLVTSVTILIIITVAVIIYEKYYAAPDQFMIDVLRIIL